MANPNDVSQHPLPAANDVTVENLQAYYLSLLAPVSATPSVAMVVTQGQTAQGADFNIRHRQAPPRKPVARGGTLLLSAMIGASVNIRVIPTGRRAEEELLELW